MGGRGCDFCLSPFLSLSHNLRCEHAGKQRGPMQPPTAPAILFYTCPPPLSYSLPPFLFKKVERSHGERGKKDNEEVGSVCNPTLSVWLTEKDGCDRRRDAQRESE